MMMMMMSISTPPLHALMFTYSFIVVHPCFIACDNPLQGNLSFTIPLQKLHAHFHTCPFMLICKLLCHPLHTNFEIPKVLMDDEICRSIAVVQLVGCISDSNSSVLLN